MTTAKKATKKTKKKATRKAPPETPKKTEVQKDLEKIKKEQLVEDPPVKTAEEVKLGAVLDQVKNLQDLMANNRIIGEFKDIPNEVYHHPDCPGYSRSNLVTARRSTFHLAAQKRGELEKKETPAMAFGSMFHAFILEPELFEEEYALGYQIEKPECDRRTKEGKEIYADWAGQKAAWEKSVLGKKLFSKDEQDQMIRMRSAMLEIGNVKEILTGGQAEFENTYFFKCPYTGLLMKFRPDIILKEQRIIIDLKTAEDASPNAFRKSCANHFYDLQGFQNVLGASELFGGDWTFAFVVPEKKIPHGVGLYTLGEAEMDMGKEVYKDSVRKICEDDPKFAYGNSFTDIGLPAWAFDLSYR